MVERDGKFQVPAMVWALVFGFAADESRTLAAFRRAYNITADKTLSPSGFYQRLTPLFATYLRDLVERELDEVAIPHTVSDEFDQFRDVMVADATVLRLHRSEGAVPRPPGGQVGAKLHLLHNVTDRTIEKLSITGERPHDSTEFKTGSWLKGRLLLLDLVYFKFCRFALIDEYGGFFVSRLKHNTKPEIVAELREWHGSR
ncbi:IS4 family transposase [Halococcus thailandensis]|uniref:Putative ISH8 transposase n=1 Tax=Halococcus thailandensis JCM 13552 TaxID=1227457 RepID=M0MSQ5_9EURY|nr:putative ISH8 transposase [Halococcus thailandensis JCM 13552]